MAVIKDKIDQRRALREATRAGQPVVITIARDFGAEGHEIGKMLSCELGIPLYDNELLVRSALREGESLDKMAAYDEQLAMDNVAFLPDRVDSRSLSDKLFKSMSQVIVDLGATRSCIIEGRLSDYLLRNNPNHIAVLVTAPFEDRVEIVRKKRGLNKKKGAKLGREGCVEVIASAYRYKLRELGVCEEAVARAAAEAEGAPAAPETAE